MKRFADLNEQEILALAISNEDEDSRIYRSFADRLRAAYRETAEMYDKMALEEISHRDMLLELHRKKFGDFLPLSEQSHQLFAVTDFKVSTIDVELGAGYGFTPGSDRFVLKAILGYAFPVPGKGNDSGRQTSSMRMGSSTHATDDLMMSSLGYPFVRK